jgi:hypothetical protein
MMEVSQMIKCPVCGEYEFQRRSDNDVCPVCEWENDGLQMKNPDLSGGANDESLNEYKAWWESQKRKEAVPA